MRLHHSYFDLVRCLLSLRTYKNRLKNVLRNVDLGQQFQLI